MKRIHVRMLVLVAVLILGGLAWQAGLFRMGDCLLQGGRWNGDGSFCRLDRPSP